MKCVRFAFLVLAATLVAAGAFAQATGTIEGRIVDETKASLPGVTVEAASPNLQEAKVVTTNEQGRFRLTPLPPGTYTVKFTLPGFTAQEQANVAVGAGAVVTLHVQMRSAYKEEVTVTGSLIPRPTLEAMSPVTTMDVEQLTYQGNTRLEDLLMNLPQVFSAQNASVSNGASGTATVNLRNLGDVRTLVLIDGKRMPAGDRYALSPDLNFIPSALVKRVDLLTGGASSVYGADAVAGVVNFVLDTDFEGIRAGISGGGFQHNNDNKEMQGIQATRGYTFPSGQAWDGGQFDAYVAMGGKFADGKGHASLYLDYRRSAALRKDRRDYTNCSVLGLGDTGPACGGSSTSPTGRFFTDDGGDYTVDPATGNTFTDWAGGYAFNYATYNYMQRPDQRYAAGGFLNYKWNEHVEGYGSVMLMDDQTDAQIAPSGDFGNTLTINCDNPMLSADQYQKICVNAGYGPHDTAGLQIYRRNVEGGGRMDKLSHQSFRLVGGVKGELAKGWNYDVYGLDAVTRVPETYLNDFNILNIQDALTVDGNPNDPSTWHCRSGNVGCVPWNIFRTGGVTQAALNYLMLPLVSTTDLKTQVVSGKLTADLKEYGIAFPSAAEGIQLALGTEYRRETLDYQTDLAYQQGWGAGQGATQLPVNGFYSVKEAFLEGVIPIVQGARGAQNLTLNLGYRYSDYNVNGSHPSWKAEGAWSPDNSFKFRVGVNRATRAPNVVELFQSRSLALGGSTDPCSGATPQFTAAQCANLGVSAAQYGNIQPNSASQYNTFTGGNPNLVPEVADTKTLGVVVTPSGLPGFTAALDYYDIKLDDAIGALGADDILKQCGLTGNPVLCGLVHRDQFGSLWRTPTGYTEATNANIGKRHTEGVDANLSYTLPAGDSIFTFNLIGSYLMKSQINTGLYEYDCVGWYGNICNDPYSDHISMQPKWRHLFRATWETGSASYSLGWRMIGEMTAEEASSQAALANPAVLDQLKLNHAYHYPAYHYIDLAVSYKLKNHVQFTFGVNNIADKEPPLGANSSANDYGPGFYNTYDAYGRFIHSSIQFSF